jgi:polyphosphate kinase
MNEIDLHDPSLYINRELSLLEFNRRVLEQAQDERTPLLERLRFLTICSTNLDEFFEVRVAGLRQRIHLGAEKHAPDGLRPKDALARIDVIAHQLVAEQYRVLNEEILPALAAEGVSVSTSRDWDEEAVAWAEAFFENEVRLVLTPVALDPSHPFPMILNKSLNFFVTVEGRDDFGRDGGVAILQAPRLLPRVSRMPDRGDGLQRFTSLSSVIRTFTPRLFPGLTVTGVHPFRVTRDSNLWLEEEEIEDLKEALRGELPRRRYGHGVRLEVDTECPPAIYQLLLQQFELDKDALYRVPGPVNLYRLAALCDMVDRPDLKFRPFTAQEPSAVAAHPQCDLFAVLRERDVLLHHPYQPFGILVDLLERAARDPSVLAIQMTLYRTGSDSPLTEALAAAARGGKEVTVIIELLARFDEEQNIDTSGVLRQAGAKVVYGIVGYKAHAKMLLIVRREEQGLRRYVHLGTGNYHVRTTALYTDFGLLSSDPALARDVQKVFLQLTSLGKTPELEKLQQAPFTLHKEVVRAIDAEAAFARRGEPAAIKAKMNSLIEPKVIRALYRASQAGVKIDLVVRGVCCLRPGFPGVSENIRVRSIVGRFLEHHRVFWFLHGGERRAWCSSADWMPRNFFRRIETCFPIEDPELRQRIEEEGLDLYWEDRDQAWDLLPDGKYLRRRAAEGEAPVRAQELLLRRLARFGGEDGPE